MTRQFLDSLCCALVLFVFFAAGYIAVTEFIELRNRVEILEEGVTKGVEFEINIPDLDRFRAHATPVSDPPTPTTP